MNLIEDQGSIVINRVVSHDVNHSIAMENIHHFYFVEVDHRATAGATRNILH